jgi:hypothetical protein
MAARARMRLKPLNWPICIDRRIGLQFSARQHFSRPDAPAIANSVHRCSDGNAFNPSPKRLRAQPCRQKGRVSALPAQPSRAKRQGFAFAPWRAAAEAICSSGASQPLQLSTRSAGGSSIVAQLSAAALATPALIAASGCYARIAVPP